MHFGQKAALSTLLAFERVISPPFAPAPPGGTMGNLCIEVSTVKRLLPAALALVAVMNAPVFAMTKPTDSIQVITWVGGPNEENLVEKRYAKLWKDLKLDSKTRQKIMQAEQLLEKETGDKFRIHALRVSPNGAMIQGVLFISQVYMAAFSPRSGKYCAFNLTGNGSMVSGTECDWL